MFILIFVIAFFAFVIMMCRPINKENYMDTLKGTNTNKYMGMGMLAITTNKVDLLFCALILITIVGYVLYRAYMDHRAMTNKRACMKRAMVDYSYSSHLVRIMDKEG